MMAEGTLDPTVDSLSVSTFVVEHSLTHTTGTRRSALKFSEFPRISTLKTLFASVKMTHVVAELRQSTNVGSEDGELHLGGHIYIAIIPTSRDTDAATGGTDVVVQNVPNKQTFPLSSSQQSNEIFNFKLDGYELDLAQDPRRGAGPVAWVGNSGVSKVGKVTGQLPICVITWRITVQCSGVTPVWQ